MKKDASLVQGAAEARHAAAAKSGEAAAVTAAAANNGSSLEKSEKQFKLQKDLN